MHRDLVQHIHLPLIATAQLTMLIVIPPITQITQFQAQVGKKQIAVLGNVQFRQIPLKAMELEPPPI